MEMLSMFEGAPLVPALLLVGGFVLCRLVVSVGQVLSDLLPKLSDRVNDRAVRLLEAQNKQSK